VKSSLSPSLIAEHNYCAAKVYNKKKLGEIQTPIMIAGQELHEQQVSEIVKSLGPSKAVKLQTVLDAMVVSFRNIYSALNRRRIIANSKEHKYAFTVLPETGIFGEPDIIDCSNGKQPIIIDIKTTDKLPNEPWNDHKLQLAAYILGLQRLGFKSTHGILRYQLRNDKSQTKEFWIQLDDDLKQHIANSMQDILRIINGEEPIATDNRRKCVPCGYRNSCKWSLAKE